MPRRLNDKDAADWARVADSVTPLDPRAKTLTRSKPQQRAKADKHAAETPKPVVPGSPARPDMVASPRPPIIAAPPASLPKLDQTAARRLKRAGAPDARIDLHGMKQAEAHHRLLRFLRAAQGSGHKVVLVITGKGRSGDGDAAWWSEGERGVLRRAVPGWLATPPFRAIVAGVQSATREHGGSGAFFVQLRNRRRGGSEAP